MVSLCIIILLVCISYGLAAWVIALAAKAVGSPKGHFWVGMRVMLLLTAINILLMVFTSKIPSEHLPSVIFWSLAVVVLQVWLTFRCMRQFFGLTWKQTFAPFGAYLGLASAQVAFALLILRPFVLHALIIGAGGMSPTLEAGDRCVVNKLLRPQRMDLVAYLREDDPERPIYIKRLIGLPGERIRFEDGGVFVNDQPVTLPAFLAGIHAMPQPGSGARYYDGETILLGNDEYFFIGDNATISLDSRLLGPSHATAIMGVADLIYWPPRRIRVLR